MIQFTKLRSLQVTGLRTTNREFIMAVVNELRSKPHIKVNDAKIAQMDQHMFNQDGFIGQVWPTSVSNGEIQLHEMVSYRDIWLTLVVNYQSFGLRFPAVTVKSMSVRKWYKYDYTNYYDYLTHDVRVGNKTSVLSAQSLLNADDLYNQLEALYKAYTSKLQKNKDAEPTWETKLAAARKKAEDATEKARTEGLAAKRGAVAAGAAATR